MRFLAACAQIAPQKANIAENLKKIGTAILEASQRGVDLVVFPEACTSGYFLEGGVLESALSADQLLTGISEHLAELDKPIDVLVGFYNSSEGNLYNSAAYIEFAPGASSRIVATYKKFFLPTYGVFDEERFVSRGHELGVFDTRLGRVGVLICEDIWHSMLPTLCAVAGAQLLLVPSASPARGFEGAEIGNLAHYKRMVSSVGEEHGVYCINCQLTGFEGGKGLVGGSSISDPFGRIIAEGPVGEEYLLIAPIDLEQELIARTAQPLISDLQSAWQDIRRIVCEL